MLMVSRMWMPFRGLIELFAGILKIFTKRKNESLNRSDKSFISCRKMSDRGLILIEYDKMRRSIMEKINFEDA